MTKAVITGFACFLLFIVFHILLFHNFNIRRRFYAMARLFFIMLLAYAAAFFLVTEEHVQRLIQPLLSLTLVGFLNGAFLHYFFFHFYLHFIQIVDRSPCTRILVEIESSPERCLTLEELKQRYSIDAKIAHELDDMVIMGRLEKKGNSYANTWKGRLHYRVFRYLREFLRLEKN